MPSSRIIGVIEFRKIVAQDTRHYGCDEESMTPRTMAFNTLGGTKDLPLRGNHGAGGAV